MKDKKIAIIQHSIWRGGRLHVVINMIEVMNELGIVPDILTFKFALAKDDIKRKYNRDIQFNVKEIFTNVKLPGEWQILFFNFLSRFYVRKYDLLINNSNTSFLTSPKKKMISWVYYPRKDRNISSDLSIHLPDGPKKSFFDYKRDFFMLARYFYKFCDRKIRDNDFNYAVSEFTKAAFLRNYDIDPDKVEIVYVPVDIKTSFWKKKKNTVLSVGRITPEKRQLEQIQIAEHLPEYMFTIMGFVENRESVKYFSMCEQYITDNNISNVTLIPDANYKKMQEMLADSEFLLHNLRNEPFGITIVQGIANGCIPIVHNSGGQREAVPVEELRYNNVEEAIEILKQFTNRTREEKSKLLNGLNTHIQSFTEEIFKNKFKDILLKHLL